MTPAWTLRQEELLRDCIVCPDVFNSIVDRLCAKNAQAAPLLAAGGNERSW